jgi:hypothetical protein
MSTNATQQDDEEDSIFDRLAGRRFVSDDLAATERELVADGADLPNRGIPVQYRDRVAGCDDADELRDLIETECQKPHPNQSLIALVNERLSEVRD